MNRIELRAGSLLLDINPDTGGSIAGFDWVDGQTRVPILRRAEDRKDVLAAGSFPLVPFVNRVRNGHFQFDGRQVHLTANMAGDSSPLHGQGWLAAWTVGWASDHQAVLRYRHAADEWPWDYEARQEFALDEQGLTVRLSCKNLSSEPMPCGLGQHPYFPCSSETVLDAEVECAWTVDEQVLPLERVPASGPYDLHRRRIGGQDLDNGFGGWSGTATIDDPAWPFVVRLSAPNAHYFHIYSPAGGSFFAAEPVTHANAALNEPPEDWKMLGLRVLAPGEEANLDVRLDVRRKSR